MVVFDFPRNLGRCIFLSNMSSSYSLVYPVPIFFLYSRYNLKKILKKFRSDLDKNWLQIGLSHPLISGLFL